MKARRLNLLFVCSRAKWRSPTAERIFSKDSRYACRARGFSSKSERTLHRSDIEWADVIFVMERYHAARLRGEHRAWLGDKPVHTLDIPDEYQFMDPELIELLVDRVAWHLDRLGYPPKAFQRTLEDSRR
jgi:predicted protein tyrosine phosphatase